MADEIIHDHHHDGIDRRGFLKCIAWVGTGVLYTVGGGILRSQTIGQRGTSGADMGGFSFVQISDSHIGFSKDPNKDATATLRQAVERINALPQTPDFIIHTGDLSQLSKPSEFDTVDQVLKSAKAGKVFFVPGEHDVLTDNGRTYRERYGKDTKGDGWYSFNHRGVHFIGLVNVLNLKPGGFGFRGRDQLEWLKDDLANLSSSTPIVVFAHVPLWTVYPEWGWGTDDATQALGYLKRFGSVTVLNGAEALEVTQRLRGIIRAPAPFRIDGPEWDMSEHNNRRAGGQIGEVVLEPFQLVAPKETKPARLQIQHINQPDKMNSPVIEAVPAVAFGVLAITFPISPAIVG